MKVMPAFELGAAGLDLRSPSFCLFWYFEGTGSAHGGFSTLSCSGFRIMAAKKRCQFKIGAGVPL